MLDIAAAAGVSVGTLYNYVEGKEALLLLCAERPFGGLDADRSLPVPVLDRNALHHRGREHPRRADPNPRARAALAAPR